MSKQKKARELLLKLLSDGSEHTSNEVRELFVENGILEKDGTGSAQGNVINWMKNNVKGFLVIRKGVYKLEEATDTENEAEEKIEEKIEEDTDMFATHVERIEKELKKINKVNWKSCPEEEIIEARRKMAILKELAIKIIEIL